MCLECNFGLFVVLLLIVIIFLALGYCRRSYDDKYVRGGARKKKFKIPKPPKYVGESAPFFNPYKSLLIFDGNNIVHNFIENIKKVSFDDGLDNVSRIVNSPYSHIVIKKNDKSRTFLHKLSKKYPNITYHLVYTTDETEESSSCDDYISIMLSRNNILVSNDKYRDFFKFENIPPITHEVIKNGVVQSTETVYPSHDIRNYNIKAPTLVDKKEFLFGPLDMYFATDKRYKTQKYILILDPNRDL